MIGLDSDRPHFAPITPIPVVIFRPDTPGVAIVWQVRNRGKGGDMDHNIHLRTGEVSAVIDLQLVLDGTGDWAPVKHGRIVAGGRLISGSYE